jgi:hypothetical protein
MIEKAPVAVKESARPPLAARERRRTRARAFRVGARPGVHARDSRRARDASDGAELAPRAGTRSGRHAACEAGRPMRTRAWLLIALWLGPGASAAPASETALRWTTFAQPEPGGAVTVLAFDAASGRLAVGGERGARVLGPGPDALLSRGPVRDLAFLPDGALLAATDDGIHRLDPDGRHAQEALGAGDETRRVSRLSVAAGFAAAATSAGVRLRDRAGRWARRAELPLGAASLAALRLRGSDLELWSVVEGELWVSAFPADAPERLRFALRVALPAVGEAGLPLDALFDLPEADVTLLLPNGFALRGPDGAWRRLQASWPPGATPLRVASAWGRRLLATDRGLLLAPELAGPWQRAETPAGAHPILALAASGDFAVAATPREVLRAEAQAASATAPPAATARAPLPPHGPDVRAVQRAALEYLELDSGVARSLRTRAGRRGLLPVLSVRVGHGSDESRSRAYDQSFVSGAMRDLHDRDHDRGDEFAVEATVSWDLGDVVFNPDEVDVSRELRSVIALRDDVLDEVTQTCFERRRVLAELAARDPSDPETGALRLRAAELAAGIDAWTGGWYSRALRGPDTPGTGGSE